MCLRKTDMEDKEMKVAVLGFGTVGQGVYGMLAHSKGLEPGPVLVRPGKDKIGRASCRERV